MYVVYYITIIEKSPWKHFLFHHLFTSCFITFSYWFQGAVQHPFRQWSDWNEPAWTVCWPECCDTLHNTAWLGGSWIYQAHLCCLHHMGCHENQPVFGSDKGQAAFGKFCLYSNWSHSNHFRKFKKWMLQLSASNIVAIFLKSGYFLDNRQLAASMDRKLAVTMFKYYICVFQQATRKPWHSNLLHR